MRFILLFTAVTLALPPLTAQADPRGCPPGLAQKHNGCLPPGQAKKIYGYRYGIGDRIDGDYIILRNPGRYGLGRDETYYRVGDYIYRVDRDTRRVLDLVGLAAAILN
ncbi:excinuclease ABC subunit A [uncultured Roseovarius sp.]|uniref:excinuclease ABC subunit A n=1 Tax=Roseovarius sp. TaxID=1486281 RepID=UPI0025D7D62A|nr:excinuclease ABC subunit A [uncultured Roseovarius sp.]